MPVMKKPDGWYWGSKGPYPTKTKALQVGRAAYAAGYKESEMNMNSISEFVGVLLHSATLAHFKHLQVEGVGADAAHRALAEYYNEIVDAVDTVAENIQGAYDLIIEPYPSRFAGNTAEPLEYIKGLREYVRTKRQELPQDSEIQNDIDAIASLINKTCYRLERLK